MGHLQKFEALTPRERAVVAVAVLLDGHDAIDMLASDKERKGALCRAAKDLAELAPDLRLPLLGTLLREAISQISE